VKKAFRSSAKLQLYSVSAEYQKMRTGLEQKMAAHKIYTRQQSTRKRKDEGDGGYGDKKVVRLEKMADYEMA